MEDVFPIPIPIPIPMSLPIPIPIPIVPLSPIHFTDDGMPQPMHNFFIEYKNLVGYLSRHPGSLAMDTNDWEELREAVRDIYFLPLSRDSNTFQLPSINEVQETFTRVLDITEEWNDAVAIRTELLTIRTRYSEFARWIRQEGVNTLDYYVIPYILMESN